MRATIDAIRPRLGESANGHPVPPLPNGAGGHGCIRLLLFADVPNEARFGLGNGGKNRRHQWPKGNDVVARSMNDDYRERKTLEALLVFKISNRP